MASLMTIRLNAALTAFALLLSAMVIAWYNGTVSTFIPSLLFGIVGPVGLTFAAVLKMKSAFGDNTTATRALDIIATIGLVVGAWFDAIRALHFMQPGLPGFMSSIAVIALSLFFLCGLFDAVWAFTGEKAKQLSAAADEAARRAAAARDALSGH